jgi:hypothetical protein
MVPNHPISTTSAPQTQQPSETGEAQGSPQKPQAPQLPFLCRRPVRITIYSFLTAFALFMIVWGFLPSFLDPTFEQHIQDKEVVAGMTRDQAIAAWGSPYQMNVTYTDRGLRREEWVYEDWIDAGSVRHRYLYFEEGVLVGGWYYK